MLPIAVCCEHCLELIAREKPSSARMWILLCANQINGMVPHMPEIVNDRLVFLEKKGFITTTEHKDTISAKIHGYKTDGECSFFCTGKCNPPKEQQCQTSNS